MELFILVCLLVLIVAVVGAGNVGNAYATMSAPTPAGKASGCGAFLLGLFLVSFILLWLFAALGGGSVGPVEVRPDTAPAVRPVQAPPGPDECSNPPGRLGQVTQSDYYTLADGRGVKAICTADGWKAVTK